MLILSIPGQPISWKRVGGIANRYDTQKELKDSLQSIIISEMNKQSHQTFTNAVIVNINFWLKTPENRKFLDQRPCPSHGDLDNYVKLILDCCQNAKVFANDRLVYALQATKRYSKQPRTDIEISQV